MLRLKWEVRMLMFNATAAASDTGFVLLQPMPGLDLMQLAQTAVLFGAVAYLLYHLLLAVIATFSES